VTLLTASHYSIRSYILYISLMSDFFTNSFNDSCIFYCTKVITSSLDYWRLTSFTGATTFARFASSTLSVPYKLAYLLYLILGP